MDRAAGYHGCTCGSWWWGIAAGNPAASCVALPLLAARSSLPNAAKPCLQALQHESFSAKATERERVMLPKIATIIHNRHNVWATRPVLAFQQLHDDTARRIFQAHEVAKQQGIPVFVDKGRPDFEQFNRLYTGALSAVLCCDVLCCPGRPAKKWLFMVIPVPQNPPSNRLPPAQGLLTQRTERGGCNRRYLAAPRALSCSYLCMLRVTACRHHEGNVEHWCGVSTYWCASAPCAGTEHKG